MASPHELALESDIPPKTKSDSEWLRDMGYRGGFHEFKVIYGFKFDEEDDARRLIAQFRDEQQKEWEALADQRKSKQPKVSGAKKLELVKQAMLWHGRMGHASYHAILALPKGTEGVPSFEDLKAGDLPACDVCTSMGIDPFSLEE